jgi:hypothetical protein
VSCVVLTTLSFVFPATINGAQRKAGDEPAGNSRDLNVRLYRIQECQAVASENTPSRCSDRAANRIQHQDGAPPGRRTVNTEPLPGSLVTVTSPPSCARACG